MPGGSKAANDKMLIAALASGLTARAAGEAAKVSERTVLRRLKNPAFADAVRAARASLVEQASGLLVGGLAFACLKLRALAQRSTDERVVLSACRTILEQAMNL